MFAGEESTTTELNATTILLLGAGLLLLLSVLTSRASQHTGLPLAFLFLAVGMLAGLPEVAGLRSQDYRGTLRIGTLALALILFDGGLNTSIASVRSVLWPSATLATMGVVVTAGLAGVGAKLLGFPWPEAMLLGSVVSSTDSAAVFSSLRSSGLQLRRRVAHTLELESGLNDPMAVLLTVGLADALSTGGRLSWSLVLTVPVQLMVGAGAGVLVGLVGRWLLRRVRLAAAGLFPVLTIALALLAFGLPGLLHGSGFLSVYVAGVVIGNGPMAYRTGLLHVHDALAWLSQVSMFLLLGLLVDPSQLLSVAWSGAAVGLVLAFVARPAAVFLCLLPFRFEAKERIYMAWVGLRGAVPIILATLPVLTNAPGAHRLFNVVLFVVVVGSIVPGATVGWVTRFFHLESKAPPPPPAVLEITSTAILKGEVMSFHIERASTVSGVSIADLPFPPDTAALLVVRGQELIAARGNTVLQPGDHVYVFCRPEDKALVLLLFGAAERE